MEFAGTPAYASPENFNNAKEVSYAADLWSLAATLFHLVAGVLPFDSSSVAAAAASIGGSMEPAPDVRDKAPEHLRAAISSSFATVLAKGLEKRVVNRYKSVDEMATDLFGCLVARGERVYTAFISYRVFSEKFHAMLLYEVLNNTITPAGHRVIVYLDVKRLVKGEDWEVGFSTGLLNSMVAIPLLSKGVLKPLAELTGSPDDRQDNVYKELLIMQAIMECEGSAGKLRTIYPVLVGQPVPTDMPSYPYTGNFFVDGSASGIRQLANVVSRPTVTAVSNFLRKNGLNCPEGSLEKTVAQSVKDLFAVQAAQLWNHGELGEEEVSEELAAKLGTEPSDPPMDLEQLCALKAELRNLVPGIHEVIDRAYLGRDQDVVSPKPGPAAAVVEGMEGPSPPAAVAAETTATVTSCRGTSGEICISTAASSTLTAALVIGNQASQDHSLPLTPLMHSAQLEQSGPR